MARTSHKFDHHVPNANLATSQKGVYHASYTVVSQLTSKS